MMDKQYFRGGLWALILFSIGALSIVLHGIISTCDYWWHLKAGEWMISNQSIPFTDVFSWYASANNFYWMSHEWLSEVVLAGFDHIVRFIAPSTTSHFSGYLITACSLFLLMVILSLFNAKHYIKNVFVTMGWIILGTLLLSSVATPRPHLFSYLLLALTMGSLEHFRKTKTTKLLYLIPVYAFAWVNFHGGSSNLPYLLCLIYLISGLFSFDWRGLTASKWSHKERKQLLVTAMYSFIVLIFNPHGLKMIAYPYENMQDSYMLSIINEWQSPLLRLDGHLLVLIQVLLVVLVLLFKNRKLEFTDFLVLGGFTYLTIGSIRFSPMLYIISSFVLFPYFENVIQLKKELPLKLTKPIYQWLLGVGGLLFIGYWLFQLPSRQVDVFPLLLSDEMIETVKTENPSRLYNHYDFGSELIYHDIPVFVDGRADLYSKTILKDAVDLGFVQQDPVTLFTKYEFDYVLTYKESNLSYYLKSYPNATLITEDEIAVFYKLTIE